MKTIKLTVLLCFACAMSIAQQQPVWTTNMGNLINKIQWMQQCDYGYLICYTGDSHITGIDNTDGKLLWTNKDLPIMANVDAGKATFISGTPYMLLQYSGGVTGGQGRALIINVLDGSTVYNSKDDSVKIAAVHSLPKANGLLLESIKAKGQIITWIDTKTASVKWSQLLGNERGGFGIGALIRKIGSVSYLAGEPYIDASGTLVIAFKQSLMALSTETGNTVWKSDMPDNIANYLASPDGKLIFIGAGKKFDVISADDGKSYLSKPVKLNGNFNNIMPYNDNYIIMHSTGFNIWDVSKMAFTWDKEKDLGNVSQVAVCPNGFAALDNEEKKAKISFVDFSGKRIWDESFTSPIINMIAVVKGVWYITAVRSNILSYEKGKDIWKRDIKLKGLPSLAIDYANKNIIIYSDKILYKFGLTENNMDVLNEQIKLQDYDEDKEFAGLEVRPEGYLISTQQNLCLVDYSGKIVYNNYYTEVGLSKSLRTGFKVLSFGLGAYSAVHAFGDYFSDPTKFQAQNGVVNLDDDYNRSQLSFKTNASNLASGGLFAAAMDRHHASMATKNFVYILAKFDDGGKGLVKVDKSNGQTLSRFALTDNDPKYVVDEYDNKIFVVQNNKDILCFDSK